MGPPKKSTPTPALTVWDMQPRKRAAPVELTRAKIVKAAIAIADREGLAALSLRKVAARLKAMPMRIYTHTATKDGLLELMVDSVYGEITGDLQLRGEWRAAVTQLARRTREVAAGHAWFVELLGGRPHQGPSGLTYVELGLAALDGAPGCDDIDVRMQALRTVQAFLVGVLRGEAAERAAVVSSGVTKREWQHASAAHLARVLAEGRFPMLTRLVTEAGDPSPDAVFEEGLACVLRGIAVR